MNFKNKNHSIFLDYATCTQLKSYGIPQDGAAAYWFKNDRTIYPAERISKIKGWEKLYIAALTSDELNRFMPNGTCITKVNRLLFSVTLPMEKVTAVGPTEGAAKALFIKLLVKKNLITL